MTAPLGGGSVLASHKNIQQGGIVWEVLCNVCCFRSLERFQGGVHLN